MAAHPRSRGENTLRDAYSKGIKGSSPLTRGKLLRAINSAIDWGLIPAHAGKTVSSSPAATCSRAHPRSRGENVSPPGVRAPAQGSSPLTRGKLLVAVVEGGTQGLIPAHAGKTAPPSATRPRAEAHPRSRGENIIGVVSARRPAGSSPLTRGKPKTGATLDGIGGLIPAHAGKTAGAA